MKNFALKLFSVVCAIGLSYYVQNPSQSSVIGFVASIEFKNIPENKVLMSPLSPQARVTVRGPSRFVQRIATKKNGFVVIAPESTTNKFSSVLQESDLDISAPVEVVSIDPPEIEVVLDDRVSKEVPLVVPKIGTLIEDLKMVDLSVTPNKVKLTGPKGELEKIKSIETVPFDLSSVKGSQEERIGVRGPGGFIVVEPQVVTANLQVVSVQKERRFNALPIEVRDVSGSGMAILPSQVAIEVSGNQKLIDNLKSSEVLPFVRLKGDEKVGERIKVEVDLPKGIGLVVVEPDGVVLSKSGSAEVRFSEEERPSSSKKSK